MQIYFKSIPSSIFSKKSRGLPREALIKRSGGFTVIELMVVMGIAIVLTTSLVIQQSKWNDRLTVTTQAYELALMIRQAQVYSLGVREYKAGTGDKFNIGYGVQVDYANPGQYIFFADADRDGKYDSGEEIETKLFTRGVAISQFCGVKDTGQHEDRCSPNGGGTGNVVKANITFFRPAPNANIMFLNNGNQTSNNVIPPAKIRLVSPKGSTSLVIVDDNGQVSIQ